MTPNLFIPGISLAVKIISTPGLFSFQFLILPNENFAVLYGDLITFAIKEPLGW